LRSSSLWGSVALARASSVAFTSIIVILIAVAVAAPARAQGQPSEQGCPPSVPPSIEFLSEQPISVTAERPVEDLKIVVDVRNNDPGSPRTIRVTLNELFPAEGRTPDSSTPVTETKPVSQEVGPLETKS
jgi:hypothetical protein